MFISSTWTAATASIGSEGRITADESISSTENA
jgi:hypothetical protein